MDEWTIERYGPLTERDLWAELHPGVAMPRKLVDAARAQRRRNAFKAIDECAPSRWETTDPGVSDAA